MLQSFVGPRIRQHRRDLGLSQSGLAKAVGISPAYMNLIESNKRTVAGALLLRIAKSLKVDIEELDDTSEHRLVEELSEVAHLPSLAKLGIDSGQTSEFVGAFPSWARAISSLAQSEQEAIGQVRTLSDRLSNDPFLGETVHRMLTRMAAILSASDIITEFPDLSEDKRDRFNRIVNQEIHALSDVGEALAAYLDRVDTPELNLTPLDEVEAVFEAKENHFPEIEALANTLADTLLESRPISRRDKALTLVADRLTGLIDTTIANQSGLATASARRRARAALTEYAVGAILMPLPEFATRAEELRYDIESLAEAFSVESQSVCHRLTALPRRDGVPRFGYFQSNAAGTIIAKVGLAGLAFPRYSAACPLWVLYRAQQSPETLIRQRTLFPSGDRFIFLARAHHRGATGFGRPRHYLTDMVALSESDAQYTVYRPDTSVVVEEVGPNCRLCPRRNCLHRVEDPLAE